MNKPLRNNYKYLLALSLLIGSFDHVLAKPFKPGVGTRLQPVVVKTNPVNLWVENFTLLNGAVTGSGSMPWTTQYTGPGQASQRFATYGNEFRINNITVNGTGTWRSGIIDIAGKTDVQISIDVRSGVTGNGSLDDDNSEHYDYISVLYKIDGGAEQLIWQKRGAINNNSNLYGTITKDSLSGTTLQVIVRARATATDEFYFFDNVIVTGVNPAAVDALATVSGTISCINNTVQISGSSSGTGVSYSWTGPEGFASDDQQANVSVAGDYTLTVTGPGGATATDVVTVLENKSFPTSLTAFVNDQLTCFIPSVNINGNSSTPGVSYSWTGPGGFTASTANVSVAVGGLYTLKVTNPDNGCFRTITLTVTENKVAPENVEAVVSGILTCAETLVTLTATSSTTNVDFRWTGPEDFSSSSPEEFVSVPGNYTLTVTNLLNGCETTDTITVKQDLSECQRRITVTDQSKRQGRQTLAAVRYN
ncbi:MAG: hypothetical protein J7621_00830 [Niastella sp.]|nr:hypothetical protein [Niastella sp.]